MYAVIKTGGKQYRVAANDKITIEKLEGNPGDRIEFPEVLMFANGDDIQVGAPMISGATVVGEIDEQVKSPTVYIFKKRRRKHFRRRNGHRQLLTSVTITDILVGGAKPAAKKAAAPKKAETKVEASVEVKRQDTESKIEVKRESDTDGHVKISRSDDPVSQVKVEHADASHGAKVTSSGYDFSSGTSDAKPVNDNLSLISGVGEKSEAILRGMGYTSFAQIAAWSASDIAKVEDAVGMKGRVGREEWVEQAKELRMGGKPRAKVDQEEQKNS